MPVTPRRLRRRTGRTLLAGAAVLAAATATGASPVDAAPAQVAAADLPFSGSASAFGVQTRVEIAGFPLTDVPINGGGPTASVTGDSIGSGLSYAAFPDPGQFLTTLPDTVVGLASAGVGGLPGIDLPTVPRIPVYITADAGTPSSNAGSGPYSLSATVRPNGSTARAQGGLSADVLGNLGLVRSSASVVKGLDGTVEATAVSLVEGLTVGPLTIGQLRSVATVTQSPDGTLDRDSDLAIEGVRIAGLAVSITPEGLDVAGNVVPLPVGELLDTILGAAGMSVDLLAPEEYDERVVSPALRITVPLSSQGASIPGLGEVKGNLQVVLASSTAHLSPTAPDESIASDDSEGSGIGVLPDLPSSGSPGGLDLSPVGTGGTTTRPVGNPIEGLPQQRIGQYELFDVESLYLTLAGAGAVLLLISQMIRLLGVRTTWTSRVG